MINELVSDRTITPIQLISVNQNGDTIQSSDLEYGTHTTLYAGEQITPRTLWGALSEKTMLFALSARQRVEPHDKDHEYTAQLANWLVSDASFKELFSLKDFWDVRTGDVYGQKLDEFVSQIRERTGVDMLSLSVLSLKNHILSSQIRIAKSQSSSTESVSTVLVAQDAQGSLLERAFDGENIHYEGAYLEVDEITANPKTIALPHRGFILLGNSCDTDSLYHRVAEYIQNFGHSWATSTFVYNDNPERYGFRRFNVMDLILGNEGRIRVSSGLNRGSEHYKIRDFVKGEINENGSNAVSFINPGTNDADGMVVEQAPLRDLFVDETYMLITSALIHRYSCDEYRLSDEEAGAAEAWAEANGLKK
jgi:hypothetical protein